MSNSLISNYLAAGSDRQQKDVVAILAVRSPELDDGYLDAWADKLGVCAELARARPLALDLPG